MFCSVCGRQVENGTRFCPNCGSNLPEMNNNQYNQGSNEEIYKQRYEQYQGQYQQNQYQGQYQYNQYQNQNGYEKEENNTLAICALVFSCLGGWLGLVLSIIGLCTYKKPEFKNLCKIGLIISIVWIVILILFFTFMTKGFVYIR